MANARSVAASIARAARSLPRNAQIRTSVSNIIRYRRSFRLSQALSLPDAGWSESLAREAQAAKPVSGIAHILTVFPEAEQRLILRFRCAAD